MSGRMKLSLALTAFLLTVHDEAFADGAYFPPVATGEQVPVDMDSQMAIIVLPAEGDWDLYLRAHYSGAPAAFGWVIPFPARPVVDTQPVDENFFRDMDELTATVFYKDNCYEDCEHQGFGCAPGGMAAEGGVGDNVDIGKVTVWESGKIGIMDYVVLSSSDGEDLTAWLEEQDFVISPAAGPLIEALASEGSYFFAARIDSTLETVRDIAPVHFTIPSSVPPYYPMRLTAASASERVKFYLWVVDRAGRSWVPSSYPSMYIAGRGSSGDVLSREQHDAAMEEILGSGDGDTFIIQYSSKSTQRHDYYSFHGHDVCSGGTSCAFQAESDEMRALIGSAPTYDPVGNLGVTKLYAEIPPARLTRDVQLRAASTGELAHVVNWYWEACAVTIREECTCAVSPGRGMSGAALSCLALLAALALALARRNRGL
jgi:hypothetical protein